MGRSGLLGMVKVMFHRYESEWRVLPTSHATELFRIRPGTVGQAIPWFLAWLFLKIGLLLVSTSQTGILVSVFLHLYLL